MTGEIKDIPIDRLEIDPMNIRDDISADAELIKSIKKQGILEPLIVRPHDKNLGIVSGSRRYSGALDVGLDTVPCVVKKLSDVDARAISISENKHRKDIPGWRWNEVINEFAEDIDGSLSKTERYEKISEMTGLSESTVRNFLNIGKLPNDIQARLKKPSERSESEAGAIETIVHVQSKEVPHRVMAELARDESFRELAMEEPERAHKIATFAAKKGVEKVGDVLESIKVKPDLEPEEAYKRTKVDVSKPISLEISLGSKFNKALESYVADGGFADRGEAIKDIVRDFLKREGYL